MKNLDNPITRTVDFWLGSVLEGFVTEFAVDQRKTFSEAERYFFKGYRGKYLKSLNLALYRYRRLPHRAHAMRTR